MFLRGLGGKSADIGKTQSDAMPDIFANSEFHARVDLRSLSQAANGVFKASQSTIKPKDSIKFGGSNTNRAGHAKFAMNIKNTGIPVATEIRPVNIAVRYLIRAKD